MGKYNFDTFIERKGTSAIMTDALKEMFGRDDLMPLWIADMDFEVCPAIVDALEKRMSHHIYGYSAPSESYWNSIINWQKRRNGFEFSRDEMTYVPGIVKGIGFAINYFTKPGDKIVIQEPVYHPFKHLALGNKRVCLSNDLIFDGNFYKMDLEGLEKIFATEHPQLMILCNPHNPIGITWPVEALRTVAELAVKYGVIVVSDEIHGDLGLFGHKHTPFATVSPDAAKVAITFGAPSKTFNIPGLVSSWCVIKNPELRKGFFEWLTVNEFNASTFIATIGTQAAYENGEEWLGELKEYLEGNILAIEEYCRKNMPKIKPIRPEASFLVWLDCSEMHICHEKVIDLFVNQAGLALNDGSMFGSAGKCHMRLNVAYPRAVIIKALDKLCEALQR